MTAAVIAKTAGDGREQRQPLLPSTASHLGSLAGSERILVTKLNADGSLNPTPYYVTADEIGASDTGDTLTAVVLTADAVSLSTGTAKDITTVTLTKGTWLVMGTAYFKAAGTTTVTRAAASLSTTQDTMDTTTGGASANTYLAGATGTNIGQDAALSGLFAELTVASTQVVHLVAQATFATSTLAAYGAIRATRVA